MEATGDNRVCTQISTAWDYITFLLSSAWVQRSFAGGCSICASLELRSARSPGVSWRGVREPGPHRPQNGVRTIEIDPSSDRGARLIARDTSPCLLTLPDQPRHGQALLGPQSNLLNSISIRRVGEVKQEQGDRIAKPGPPPGLFCRWGRHIAGCKDVGG